jgi:hypothetical protein
LLKILTVYFETALLALRIIAHLNFKLMQIFTPTKAWLYSNTNLLAITLITFFFLTIFMSCSSSRFGLNKAEQDFVSKSSNKNISYKIYHDKNRIKANKQNGVYHVKLAGYGLCSKDSNNLKKGAIVFAEKLTKFMNFKNSYQYIDIEYENVSYGGPNNALGEQPVCINIVRLPIADLSMAYLRGKINTHDNNSGPNSYRNIRP